MEQCGNPNPRFLVIELGREILEHKTGLGGITERIRMSSGEPRKDCEQESALSQRATTL